MPGRRAITLSLSIVGVVLVGASLGPVHAGTADPSGPTLRLPIHPLGDVAIEGVALLTPAEDGGTSVQLLVTGAPAGTVAVIHPRSCEGPVEGLVALLGDVGSGPSLQVTIPIAIEVLADGDHAIALHPDLAFETTLACGTIPARDGAEMGRASPGAPPAGGSYTSPRYGFSLSWDETWQRVEDIAPEGVDRITLDDELSTVVVAGFHGHSGDAAACIAAWEDSLFEGVRAGTVRELAPLQDADGLRVAGGDHDHAWAAYRYVHDPATIQTADFRECWALPDGSLVELSHVSLIDDYSSEALAREAVVATLTLPETPPRTPDGPEATPTAEERAPIASTTAPATAPPGPTMDPACAGVSRWVEATRGRLDRIVDLQAEADAFIADGDVDGYVAAVGGFAGEVRGLQAAQEQDPVPAIAQSVNQAALQTLGHYIEAGETLYRHITVSATTGTYQRFLDAIQAANDGAGKVRTQLGDLAGRCP